MTGHAGQEISFGQWMSLHADISCIDCKGLISGQGKWRTTKFNRVDAEQKMMHHRVGNKGQFEDVSCFDVHFPDNIIYQGVDSCLYRLGHCLFATGVHHDVGNTAHQIFTKTNLWIHDAATGDNLTGREITKVTGDGGRPNVNCKPVDRLFEPWPYSQDFAFIVDCHGYLPISRAQGCL